MVLRLSRLYLDDNLGTKKPIGPHHITILPVDLYPKVIMRIYVLVLNLNPQFIVTVIAAIDTQARGYESQGKSDQGSAAHVLTGSGEHPRPGGRQRQKRAYCP